MIDAGDDTVALRLLHTADWHLGMPFASFPEATRRKLERSRIDVLTDVFGLAERENVDAVLCAGDLFDSPDPGEPWWKALLTILRSLRWERRKIFMLPGNHDPLTRSSVWDPEHPFRRGLPSYVHVIDRENYEAPLSDDAVLYASPCRGASSSKDQAMGLPAREAGDARIRIGMVHGMTFDLEGYQANFPIRRDAAFERGFDYIALGDTHSFRDTATQGRPPMVYPSAPEPTRFGERNAGNVAMVLVTRNRRVQLREQPVARWTWREETVDDVDALQRLSRENLRQTVLRLTVRGFFSPADFQAAEEICSRIVGGDLVDGLAGACLCDRTDMSLDAVGAERFFEECPDEIRTAAKRLEAMSLTTTPEAPIAKKALLKLYRLARKETV